MACISVRHESDLFIITVAGDLSFDEITATMRLHYTTKLPCDVLWDLSQGSLNSVTLEQFREVALVAKSLIRRRAGGRTAYVADQNVMFNLTCMYTALAVLAEIPIEYSVFKTVAEARAWVWQKNVTGVPGARGAHSPALPQPSRTQALAYSKIGPKPRRPLATISAVTIPRQSFFSPGWPRPLTFSPKSVASMLRSVRRRMGLVSP
jgi:hypothetical protein